MSQHLRVATFEMDAASLDALIERVRNEERPEGVPATRLTILADRAAGRVLVGTRFDSEEDLRAGSAALDAMEPPAAGSRRRVSVDAYEVVLEREF